MYGSQLRHYPEQFGKFLARYVVEHPFWVPSKIFGFLQARALGG